MNRIVSYEIKYCNTQCPHFYHNYDDNENVWCAALNKKIFDVSNNNDIFHDLKERDFPKECPLENAKV